jgi:RNA polymerase sigma factor (sigma-70 family)
VGVVDREAHETQNLVERIRRGETSAQMEFVNRYRGPIQAIATVRTADPEAARDICQDVLIAVLASIERGQIREPGKLGAFIQGTARNLVNNFLRTRERRREVDFDSIDLLSVDPQIELEAQERERLVRSALTSFSATDQGICLRYFEGYTLAEIARELGISHTSVRKRKERMMAKMEKIIRNSSQE